MSILSWLCPGRRPLFREPARRFPALPPRTTEMGATLTDWEHTQLAEGFCPDCGNFHCLREGPQGGSSMNVACDRCGSEFNMPMLRGMNFGHRNSKQGQPNLERLSSVFHIHLGSKPPPPGPNRPLKKGT